VAGAAKAMFLCKRPLKQAPLLTTDIVWALENLLFAGGVDNKLKAIIGFMLFCLYSSSRFGDASRSHGIVVDSSGHMLVLETAAAFYKVATAVEKSTTVVDCHWWLRDLICLAGFDVEEAPKCSCHSLKCTAISWVTKAGVMSVHEKKTTGHHWDSENAMLLTCSRDALCDIMVKLYRVVHAIKTGQFDPDA
jgi:hypothetical protein